MQVNLGKDLRGHCLKAGVMSSIGIFEILRNRYPAYTVTQTPGSTGIMKLAKAGLAQATLDHDHDFYASLLYKPINDHVKSAKHLCYDVE